MKDKDRFARHLCLGVDAKGYSGRDTVGQDELQRILPVLLDQAAQAAGLDRERWIRQPQGDCELSLIPSDQAEPRIVDDFIRELDAVLDRYNHGRLPGYGVRLRAAAHFGVAYPSDLGFAGQAVIVTSDLLATRELHDALADTPDADLVLMLSDRVFTDIVVGRHVSTRQSEFSRVDLSVRDYVGPAWIRRLRRAAPAIGSSGSAGGAGHVGPAAPVPAAPPGAAPAQPGGVQSNFYAPVTADVIGISMGPRDHR